MTRRKIVSGYLVAILVNLFFTSVVLAESIEAKSKDVVLRSLDKFSMIEKSKNSNNFEVRKAISEDFSIYQVAGWTLGRKARETSPLQRDLFVDLYSDYFSSQYYKKFVEFNVGETTIDKIKVHSDRKILVYGNTFVKNTNIEIIWQVGTIYNGTVRISDIVINKQSLITQIKTKLSERISKHGDDFEGFLNSLLEEDGLEF